jgi:hypothetical protein
MSRYWRINAPIGHDYENSDDARQVAVVLHYAFLSCNVIHSTFLSNNIRCVELYEHTVKCHEHCNDRNVFLLIEATDAVCESHIVFFLANQFLGRPMIPAVKSALGKLRFSMTQRTEYESVQAAYDSDTRSRDGIMVADAA